MKHKVAKLELKRGDFECTNTNGLIITKADMLM